MPPSLSKGVGLPPIPKPSAAERGTSGLGISERGGGEDLSARPGGWEGVRGTPPKAPGRCGCWFVMCVHAGVCA